MEQQEIERIQATALYPRVLVRSEVFVPCDCTPTVTNINSSNTNTKPILLLLGVVVILGLGFCLGLQMMANEISLMNKQNQTLQTQNALITKELKQTQTAISNFKKCLVNSGI